MNHIEEWKQTAIEAARLGGQILTRHFRTERVLLVGNESVA